MANLALNTLYSAYSDNPIEFIQTLNGDSSTSLVYQDLVQSAAQEISSLFSSISQSTIVQLDMDGNVLFSNNIAHFAQTKNNIKEYKGTVEKAGPLELLVADPVDKKAFIISLVYSGYVDAGKEFFEADTFSEDDENFLQVIFADIDINVAISRVIWQYDSFAMVCGFRLIPQNEVIITIRDDAIDSTDVFIRQGTLVTWENNSASPISIYSGTTTYDQFQADPNLSLYGDTFQSGVLEPGQSYSYKFVSVEEINYFTYPGILTGKVTVTSDRISSSDQFLILENDGLDSPFSSRVIRVDSWGNILWSFGDGGYLVKPRDARPLLSGGVIISV
jgi:hypothetical protein